MYHRLHVLPTKFEDLNTHIHKKRSTAKTLSSDCVSGQAIIFTAELTEYWKNKWKGSGKLD